MSKLTRQEIQQRIIELLREIQEKQTEIYQLTKKREAIDREIKK